MNFFTSGQTVKKPNLLFIITHQQRFDALSIAGNLSADGVTGQALYSFLKEEWRTDATKIPFLFPMEAIGPEKFEFINGWELIDDASRKLVRTAGWREVAVGGAVKREYLGVVSLGNIDAASKTSGDKAYYAFSTDAASTEFTYAGPVNEAIQTYGDGTNGNFDKRTDTLAFRVAEPRVTVRRQLVSDSLQIGVRLFPPPPPAALCLRLAARFPLLVGHDGVTQFRLPILAERLRQFLSPDGRTDVSSRNSSVSTGRIPFGSSVVCRRKALRAEHHIVPA